VKHRSEINLCFIVSYTFTKEDRNDDKLKMNCWSAATHLVLDKSCWHSEWNQYPISGWKTGIHDFNRVET